LLTANNIITAHDGALPEARMGGYGLRLLEEPRGGEESGGVETCFGVNSVLNLQASIVLPAGLATTW